MEIYKKGIHSNELRKLMLMHNPPLITMATLKAAVQGYQTSLLKYARTLTNPPASATMGLGTLQYEDDMFWALVR